MIDISKLDPEQLELIERYQKVHTRVSNLQTRIEVLKVDLEDAMNELTSIRNEEKLKQIINTHGKEQ